MHVILVFFQADPSTEFEESEDPVENDGKIKIIWIDLFCFRQGMNKETRIFR